MTRNIGDRVVVLCKDDHGFLFNQTGEVIKIINSHETLKPCAILVEFPNSKYASARIEDVYTVH